MSIKYQDPRFDPEKLNKNNIDRMALSEVPKNSFVLDVGCATGFMGKYLGTKKGCRVVGLDTRKDEIKKAYNNLDLALLGSIEDKNIKDTILQKTNNKKFDVILATSLIEHTSNPQKVVNTMKNMLKVGGKIVMTTPNIVHWSVRLNMFKGNFDYTKYGIMDETHLHFFTIKSFKKLFTDAGLKIETLKIDAEGGGMPRISLLLSSFFPNLFAYQILIVGKKE